jgi:hypothetical protein
MTLRVNLYQDIDDPIRFNWYMILFYLTNKKEGILWNKTFVKKLSASI